MKQFFSTLRRGTAAVAAIAACVATAAAAPQTTTVADGPVRASVRIDRDAVQVAEPIQLTLEVLAPAGTRVELPQLAKELGDFAIRTGTRTKDIPAGNDANQRRWTWQTSLDSIKTGRLTIPTLEIHYATAASPTTFKTLATKPLAVEIKSVLENRADPTKFRDIQGTVDLPLPAERSLAWLKWSAVGLGSVLAIALATLAVVRRRRGPTPAAWALAAIADLEQLPIANSADAESAYNEVVDVLREYFEMEFKIPVLAKTTREFLAEATKNIQLEKTPRDRLASLAAIADDIKFARRGVGGDQVADALAQAKAFITECEAFRRAARKEAA